MLNNGIEMSIHECCNSLLRELNFVFPNLNDTLKGTTLYAIATCQHARYDLSQIGKEIDEEKDLLLEKFIAWAAVVSDRLSGYFVDYIDPCSGLPMRTPNTTCVYSEVDGMENLLRYRSLSAGMCKILLHPEWGAAVYPATMFTNAPLEEIRKVIMEYNNKLESFVGI